MSKFNTGTRRGTLQNVRALLENPEELQKNVGVDAELDCTLALIAMLDPSAYAILDQYLNVEELIADVRHINSDMRLRKIKRGS